MIRIIGTIDYRDSESAGLGRHWRYSASKIIVSCDKRGCPASAEPSGLEHNGPVIECIYGLNDWHLAEKTLCPLHAPAQVSDGGET